MLRLQKSKFKEYELDYKIVTLKEEPSSLIIIDNRFEQQRILIERNKNTFQPRTIATLLAKNIGAQLQMDQAEADKNIAQAKAEERRSMAIASEQEMKAKAQEARAKVIEAEALVPQAMAEAFRKGNLGIMDYYRMQNMQADTAMRENIAGTGEKKAKK